MRYTREGRPASRRVDGEKESEEEDGEVTRRLINMDVFKNISRSLFISDVGLLYGFRVAIPLTLYSQVLKIIQIGHFGMQRWLYIGMGLMLTSWRSAFNAQLVLTIRTSLPRAQFILGCYQRKFGLGKLIYV